MKRRHLVLLHGFTQAGAIWTGAVAALTEYLGPETSVSTPDLPGHGSAGAMAHDLSTTADRLADSLEPGIVIGYSMGARVALHLALGHPEAVEALIMIGVHPGIESDDERAARRRSDQALADEIERIGVDDFVARWLDQPMFAGLSTDQADLGIRRSNTAAGLAASLRTAGLGTQTPLWNRLGEIGCPTLLVVGEHDAKFTALAERAVALIPGARTAIIPGAGHAAHLERPTETLDEIAAWIDSLDSPDAERDLSRGR